MDFKTSIQNAFAETQSAVDAAYAETIEKAKMRDNINHISDHTLQIEKLNEKVFSQAVEITTLNRVIVENTADIKHLRSLVAELENNLKQEFADRAAADITNKRFTIKISLATAVFSFVLAHIADIYRFLQMLLENYA